LISPETGSSMVIDEVMAPSGPGAPPLNLPLMCALVSTVILAQPSWAGM